jgi:hypothetical protein
MLLWLEGRGVVDGESKIKPDVGAGGFCLYLSPSVLIFLVTIGGQRGNLLTENYANLVL